MTGLLCLSMSVYPSFPFPSLNFLLPAQHKHLVGQRVSEKKSCVIPSPPFPCTQPDNKKHLDGEQRVQNAPIPTLDESKNAWLRLCTWSLDTLLLSHQTVYKCCILIMTLLISEKNMWAYSVVECSLCCAKCVIFFL